jgi:hypothetical protein
MCRNRRVERRFATPRLSAVLIRAGHTAKADRFGRQNCRDLPGFAIVPVTRDACTKTCRSPTVRNGS